MFCCNVDDNGTNVGSIPNWIQPGDEYAEDNKAFFDNSLEFQLPAISAGETRELLVVAESNDENGAPSGKLFPVLKINLRFKNNGTAQNGYSYTSNGITGAKYGWVKSGGVNAFNTNNGSSNAHTRFTIPVSEAGLYSLTANTKLERKSGTPDNTDETITHAVIHDEGIADTNGKKLYYGDMSQHYALSQYENLTAQGIIEVYETLDDPFEHKAISVPVYVTEADVRRGYIVWDWNTEDLSGGCEYSLRVADILLTKDKFSTRYLTTD